MNKTKILIISGIIIIIIMLFLSLSKNNKTYSIGDTLADTVIAQNKGSTWNVGDSGIYYTNNHEYRYIGTNVNNYVSFNNDLYRIIGVFDSNSHGQDGKMLVKLIRNRILGSYSWGAYNTSNTSGIYSSYRNDWTGENTGVKANLNILLNEYFYNKTDTSNIYGNCSKWTYYYNNTNYRTNDCTDIVEYGINNSLQNYIEEVDWFLYGYSGASLSKQNFYLCERGQYSGCTSANNGESVTSTSAKIGLMYASDYLYATSYILDNVGSSDWKYAKQNWLYKGSEWLITPASNNNQVYAIRSYGPVDTAVNSCNGNGVRPTFYLKSSVYVTGGNGTFDDPYTISCDDCN